MPGIKHYIDTPNDADFLEKFARHHADPAKRHISQYEAERIRKIADDFLELTQNLKTDLNRLDAYAVHDSKYTHKFSINERERKVASDLKKIFSDSENLRIITGYSSMKEILRVIN